MMIQLFGQGVKLSNGFDCDIYDPGLFRQWDMIVFANANTNLTQLYDRG